MKGGGGEGPNSSTHAVGQRRIITQLMKKKVRRGILLTWRIAFSVRTHYTAERCSYSWTVVCQKESLLELTTLEAFYDLRIAPPTLEYAAQHVCPNRAFVTLYRVSNIHHRYTSIYKGSSFNLNNGNLSRYLGREAKEMFKNLQFIIVTTHCLFLFW